MAYTPCSEQFWKTLNGHIDAQARARIEALCEASHVSVPVAISQLGLAPDGNVAAAYASTSGLRMVQNLEAVSQDELLEGLSQAFVKQFTVLCYRSGRAVSAVLVDPNNKDAVRGIAFAAGQTPDVYVTSLSDWRAAVERLYGYAEVDTDTGGAFGRAGWADDATRLGDMASEAPVIRRVERLLTQAVDAGASDIHVEPAPNASRIRMRIDGELQNSISESPDLAAKITSRVKVMCDMDVSDSRRPQDGRTSVAVRGRPIDLRVSTVPTAYGESLAIRLLDRSASLLDLETLGFSSHDLDLILQILNNPKGIFLVTGPTGSGKTTTLYAALNRLRKVARKILTVEDPIEYFFDDVNQVQVNEGAGVTFASILRSFLRQDPNILMVGEIRDSETAATAVQAALTGHLVLSTLHTNDAVSAIARLKDMGIEDYLIAATLSGVTAQRLVRKPCPNCQRSPNKNLGKSSQCMTCQGSGYKGRSVISEGFACTPEISDLICQGTPHDRILKLAKTQGMKTLLEDGRAKAAKGLVRLEDVYAATGQ